MTAHLVAELSDRLDAALLMPDHGVSTDGDSEALRDWLYEQEDAHDLVIFGHAEGHDTWNELARRQADLLLFIADGRSAPGDHVHALTRTDYGAQHALVLLQPAGDAAISGTGNWLDACPVDFHMHLRDGEPEDLARLARVLSGRAVGLVLSAGAARGFAHIGVYRAMRELGIPVDWIGGSSIGSIMGAAMAAGWDLERIEQTARQCFVQGKPFSDYTIPVTSLIRGRRMTQLLKEHLDFRIEDLPIPFFCVSSVLDDGSLNLHQRGSLASALCASAALPGVIPPAVVNRRLAIDGSVLNSLPVDLMQKMPVGRIVAVDLSSQKSYEVEYDEVPPAWRILAGRYLPFMKRQRVPPLSTIMLKATEIGTLERMRELGRNADLLLRPDVRGFGITEVRTFDRIVETGYHCALQALEDWRADSAP
jgi:NTE family protein